MSSRSPYKYNPTYHDDWAWSLAVRGCTSAEIAEAFNVSKRTIERWQREHASFSLSIRTGKDAADATVERKLYERCTGYTYTEEQQTIDIKSDGSNRIGQIKKTEKHVPPDTMAIMYWLNNRKRKTGEWAMRQNVNLTADPDVEDVIIYLPDNGRDVGE